MRSLAALFVWLVTGSVAVAAAAAPGGTPAAWPPAKVPAVRQELGVRIPMRDGVVLVADVWMPSAPGRYPVVLHRTPYQRNVDSYEPRDAQVREARWYAERGIAYVIQDVRGRGESEGEFTLFRAEGADGHDTIEWLARQPWSNGQVAMIGGSYKGTVQWLAARERPKHLTCLLSQSPGGVYFDEVPYLGGAYQYRWAMSWPLYVSGRLFHEPASNLTDWDAVLSHRPLATMDRALGRELPMVREFLAHPTFDAYWRAISLGREDFERLGVPALHVTGWYDGTMPGTLHYWRGMRAHSPARTSQRLVIGPWTHAETRTGGSPRLNERERGAESVVDVRDLAHRWFRSCFAGTTAEFDAPVARVFLTGINRWLDLPEYPAAARVRSLHLDAGEGALETAGGRGTLAWAPPRRERSDTYRFDPTEPAPPRGTFDRYRTKPSPRADVLVYTSPAFDEPLAILGPVELVLHASTSARDTDFVADLYDVAPDGREIKIVFRTAVLRARYREGYERQVPMLPGAPTELRLKFHDMGHVVLPGHRLKLEVSSSTPGVHPNPNTGDDIATDTRWVEAQQRVYYGRTRPSRLELPVIEVPK